MSPTHLEQQDTGMTVRISGDQVQDLRAVAAHPPLDASVGVPLGMHRVDIPAPASDEENRQALRDRGLIVADRGVDPPVEMSPRSLHRLERSGRFIRRAAATIVGFAGLTVAALGVDAVQNHDYFGSNENSSIEGPDNGPITTLAIDHDENPSAPTILSGIGQSPVSTGEAPRATINVTIPAAADGSSSVTEIAPSDTLGASTTVGVDANTRAATSNPPSSESSSTGITVEATPPSPSTLAQTTTSARLTTTTAAPTSSSSRATSTSSSASPTTAPSTSTTAHGTSTTSTSSSLPPPPPTTAPAPVSDETVLTIRTS